MAVKYGDRAVRILMDTHGSAHEMDARWMRRDL